MTTPKQPPPQSAVDAAEKYILDNRAYRRGEDRYDGFEATFLAGYSYARANESRALKISEEKFGEPHDFIAHGGLASSRTGFAKGCDRCEWLQGGPSAKGLKCALKIAEEALDKIANTQDAAGADPVTGGPDRMSIIDSRNRRILEARDALTRMRAALKGEEGKG